MQKMKKKCKHVNTQKDIKSADHCKIDQYGQISYLKFFGLTLLHKGDLKT
jgi:hypothetical protein